MKYITTINYYVPGSGYSHSEIFDHGECDTPFTAQEWNASLDEPFADNDDGWVEIEINFYTDDADPMFDDPISTSTYTV